MQELLPEETASFWYISFGWSQQIEQENTNELIRLILSINNTKESTNDYK